MMDYCILHKDMKLMRDMKLLEALQNVLGAKK